MLKNFCLASITYITLDSSTGGKVLKFRELDSAIRVQKVSFNFENLVRFVFFISWPTLALFLFIFVFSKHSTGPRGMVDKALACRTGGQGSNSRQDQEFFCFRKIQKYAPILSGTPPCELSLSHNACCHVLQLVTVEAKREESWKGRRY